MHQAILTRQPSNYGTPESLVPTSKPQRRFQFIDNNNVTSMGTNSTQVRRHVMQEYMREKRWEARSKLENDPDAEVQPRKPIQRTRHRKTTSISRRSKTKSIDSTSSVGTLDAFGSIDARLALLEVNTPSNSGSPFSQHTTLPGPKLLKPKPRSFVLRPSDFARIADMWPDIPSQTSLSTSQNHVLTSNPIALFVVRLPPKLRTILSAARTDPFDCLPLSLNRDDQELFDFYATYMPQYAYGIRHENFHNGNWSRTVFIPEAINSPLGLQITILATAAQVQAQKRGFAATHLSLMHRGRGNKMLSEHNRDHTSDCSDTIISATLSAALLADLDTNLEQQRNASLHWQAVISKICKRGGLPTLAQSPRIQMLLIWSDYILTVPHSYGNLFASDYDVLPNHLNNSQVDMLAWQDLRQQYSEFITFLKCIEHLAMVQANMQYNPVARGQQPLRYSAFQPGWPLYNILVKQNESVRRMRHTFREAMCRVACLITLNVAIWEYRHTVELSEEYFAELTHNVRQNGLGQFLSTEVLVQILLSGNKHPGLQHSERPWIVGRMLKVVRRLSKQSFEFLNTFLLTCLTLGSDLQPVVRNWETQLEMEVSQAPLVMENIPFLQI